MTRNTNSEEPRLLHEFFDWAAHRWPERVAIDVPPGNSRSDRRLVTYAELRRQSDVLAGLLRPFIEGECVVAILISRNSEHIYSSQLAVLKAGAAYACIDTVTGVPMALTSTADELILKSSSTAIVSN